MSARVALGSGRDVDYGQVVAADAFTGGRFALVAATDAEPVAGGFGCFAWTRCGC